MRIPFGASVQWQSLFVHIFKTFREKKATITALAKKLDISRATIHRLLLQHPGKAPPFDQTEAWRDFLVNRLTDADTILKLWR